MLINADREQRSYYIVLNNASDHSELMADLSYLEGAPPGQLTLDFRQMAAPLTQEERPDYLPGGFGYQPTRLLLELIGALMAYLGRTVEHPHMLVAILPSSHSKVGHFLAEMHLPQILRQLGVRLEYADPTSIEYGEDDPTRQNLIPLTLVTVAAKGPDHRVLRRIREGVEQVFAQGLPGTPSVSFDPQLTRQFATVVNEAVDNMVEYGEGGVIGGLYYRRVGEVEISLVNRCGGFGGAMPHDQLVALIDAYEGVSRRVQGGGNGIAALSRLAGACFGTLLFRNGNATLRLSPDGSIEGDVDETGIETPGAAVTLILQLLPAPNGHKNETVQAFETVLRTGLADYIKRGNRQ
jgi:hypothetical protein